MEWESNGRHVGVHRGSLITDRKVLQVRRQTKLWKLFHGPRKAYQPSIKEGISRVGWIVWPGVDGVQGLRALQIWERGIKQVAHAFRQDEALNGERVRLAR